MKRFYRKITLNTFVKFHGKKIWEPHSMVVLYPNLCYNKVCYIGAALYKHVYLHFQSKPLMYV